MIYSMDKTTRSQFEVKHFDAFKRTIIFTVLQKKGLVYPIFEGM